MKKICVGLFQASFPVTCFDAQAIQNIEKFYQEKNIEVVWGKLTQKRNYYRSGTAKERAEEIMELVKNPKVTCLQAVIGGAVTSSVLKYLDFEEIKKQNKSFIGYSDSTALLNAVQTKTQIPVFYGPAAVPSFARPVLREESFKGFEQLFLKNEVPMIYQANPFYCEAEIHLGEEAVLHENQWLTLNSGVVKGRLLGGNLNTFCTLLGTEYAPEIRKGDILLVEDENPSDFQTERSLAQLSNAGIFEKIAGLIIGRPNRYNQKEGKRPYFEIFDEFFEGVYPFPVLANVECSHVRPILCLPLGGEIELNASEQKITVLKIVKD